MVNDDCYLFDIYDETFYDNYSGVWAAWNRWSIKKQSLISISFFGVFSFRYMRIKLQNGEFFQTSLGQNCFKNKTLKIPPKWVTYHIRNSNNFNHFPCETETHLLFIRSTSLQRMLIEVKPHRNPNNLTHYALL